MINFTKVIKAKLSRFSKQLHKYSLFNIKTGTQGSKNVEKYILTLFRCGQGKGDVILSEWNVVVNLNDLCNMLARQPLLLLLRKILKEKINQEK